MKNVVCPSCNKLNSNKVEICQYCGAVLKRSATEPLAPIHTGDVPVKRKTSDLENTLPGWLRDARQASKEETGSTAGEQPAAPGKPEAPRKKTPAGSLDLLAGLSQVNDDDEETPDWMKDLQDSIPEHEEAPQQDVLPQPQSLPDEPSAQPEQPAQNGGSDWGFGEKAEPFQFQDSPQAAPSAIEEPSGEESSDWLTALQNQDDSAKATLVSKPSEMALPPMGDLPDWLSALTGGKSSQPDSVSSKPLPAENDDTPDWLSGLGGDFTPEENFTPAESSAALDAQAPDWLTRMDEPSGEIDRPAPAETGFSDADLPAWLNGLSAAAKPSTQPVPELQPLPEESGVLDWFGAAQDAPSTPAALPETSTNSPAEGIPDWMTGLQDSAATPITPHEVPTASQTSIDDLPDWMRELQTPAPDPVTPSENPAEGIPDWMAGLQDSTPAAPAVPSEMPAAVQTPIEDMPDWMRELQAPAPTSVVPSENPAEGIPDWMTGLQDLTPAVPAVPSEMSAAVLTPIEDMPDWMRELQTPAPDPVAQSENPAEGIPDWMAGLQDLTPVAAAAPSETSAAVQAPLDDLPDWMRELQSTAPSPAAPTEISAAAQTGPVEDDLPDWMRDLQPSNQVSAAPAAEIETTGNLDAGIPDWMVALQDPAPLSSAPLSPETPAVTPTPQEDVPDWMRSSFSPDSSEPQSQTAPAQDLPAWLGAAMSEPLSAAKAEEPSPDFMDTLVPGQGSQVDSAKNIPDWMAGLGAPGDTLSTAASKPAQQAESVMPAQKESGSLEIPPSVKQGESPFTSLPDEQNLDSILAMDVPDWLAGFKPSDAEKTAVQVNESPLDASLLPAELPSWVQAMRPMESVMAGAGDSQDDQEVENQGPLAGLRSVLPVQSEMAGVYSSKPYALKILADETQMAQAALLEDLLNSESMPQKAPARAQMLNIRALRWLIAALLLLAVLIPLVLKTQIFPVPPSQVDPNPAGAFFTIISNLSASQPVLMVVDYQPGFAGELEKAVAPVIAQLAGKNVPLAFISTSPVGPFMAERLLKTAASSYQAVYQLNDQYVNLGYLPGGAGGIKAFAERPASTVGQDTILGNMWNTPALSGATVNAVTSLSNFGAVIVLTDNPDIGRLWIEQAGPSLRPKPMLMVVSAQAEPMIRPYMFSNQVDGLIAGLEGAALYENRLGTTGQNGPRASWDAFGVAMLAAELLILIGGAWGLITGLRARRNAIEQDEA